MAKAPMVEAAVEISGLKKSYGDTLAVAGANLMVPKGKLFGLIGPDGAGKSSLMKTVAGVMSYEGGEVRVLGHRLSTEKEAETVKPKIGFMPQGLGQNLYPDLSIDENIDFIARLRLVEPQAVAERKERLLQVTRLLSFRDRAMKNLSGGMKQKLGLICTLIHEPALIILDEPTTGVDPVSRRDFWGILAELLGEKGTTALVSSAYMDEASRFDLVSLMHQGKILTEGHPRELVEKIEGLVVNVCMHEQVQGLARLRAKFTHAIGLGEWIRVLVPTSAKELPEREKEAEGKVRDVLSGFTVKEIFSDTPDLEDLMISLLHEEEEEEKREKKRQAQALVVLPPGAAPKETPEGAFAIEAQGLVKAFGAFKAVDGVSFHVRQGEIFGLLGANGAGKTTVIKMLTGILTPTSGKGHVGGADMYHAGKRIKERIGYMSQAFSLYQDLTAEENLRLYGAIYGVHPNTLDKRLAELLELTDLFGQEKQLAGNLPMGMRQRLALACALVHHPKVLFLDEPTSGVDPIGRRHFWDLLFHLSREEKVAMLVTTHYMSEAEYCDHLVLMHAGKAVADDTPEGMKRVLVERLGQPLEIETNAPYQAQRALKEAGFLDAQLYGSRVHLFARHVELASSQIRQALESARLECRRIHPRPPTMEDVFVENVLEMEKRLKAA